MKTKKIVWLISDSSVFVLTVASLLALVLDFGFSKDFFMHLGTDIFYLVFGLGFSLYYLRQFPRWRKLKTRPPGYYVVVCLSVILVGLALLNLLNFLLYASAGLNFLTAASVFTLTLFEISARIYRFNQQNLHPALVFALSFAVLILIGCLLLMTPNATVNGISFIDALFTSASAVCVTGLAVLDTGKDFTLLGQTTILCLIQLGAIGMLSFTSLFALFFRGYGSIGSRLYLKDMVNASTLNATVKTLLQILLFVFVVEMVGAVVVFFSLGPEVGSVNQRIYFSIFHSVSAFCNAGFSTLSNSLYEEGFRFNYSLHMVIAGLIVFGGLGFKVVINLSQFVVKWVNMVVGRMFRGSSFRVKPRMKPRLELNTRIVLNTTIVLLVGGMVLFYLLEYNHSLAGHSEVGKIGTSFFGSVTTRTAGFNTVDTGTLQMPTLLVVLFLMWVGASPGSTGGGIKTTTFAVATYNVLQQAFGSRNIRIGYRRLPQRALQRATAIILLSVVAIGASIFLVVLFDEELGFTEIAFECLSAYSTVGLSMGITGDLSGASKGVITVTMFLGRVGFLTILTGIVRQFNPHRYSPIEYPEEEILIN